jgi:hypothetical protein
MPHQVNSHGLDSAMRARVNIPSNLKRLAEAALKHVPNSQHYINKAFDQTTLIKKQLKPQPQPDLVFHHGFDTV